MLCSTIIPTVARQSLARAVQSALDQGLELDEHEIIVVNDSGHPLEPSGWMQEPRVRVVDVNQCGESVACNVGVAVARGRYLNFVHDDDYLLPGALRALTATAASSGADWVAGAHQVADLGGTLVATRQPGIRGNAAAFFLVGEGVHIGTVLMTREAYLQVGGCDPQAGGLVDSDLFARMALRYDAVTTSHIVACIRVSLSTGSTYRATEQARVFRIQREKVLSSDGALGKMIDSAGDDAYMRGRVFRSYVFSAGLNLLARRLWTVVSRLTAACRAAGLYPMFPAFWRGAAYRHKFDDRDTLTSA
jgi:hypothetical protein